MIGQPDFNSGLPNQGGVPGPNTLNVPFGAPAEGSLYLADAFNNRVLGFNAIPTANNTSADFVLGQTEFNTGSSSLAANKFNASAFTATANGKLFVSDHLNHRVLIWNTLPTGDVDADVVVGQANFTTGTPGISQTQMNQPAGIAVAGGRLIVSDALNNRVLIWNTIPTTNSV